MNEMAFSGAFKRSLEAILQGSGLPKEMGMSSEHIADLIINFCKTLPGSPPASKLEVPLFSTDDMNKLKSYVDEQIKVLKLTEIRLKALEIASSLSYMPTDGINQVSELAKAYEKWVISGE